MNQQIQPICTVTCDMGAPLDSLVIQQLFFDFGEEEKLFDESSNFSQLLSVFLFCEYADFAQQLLVEIKSQVSEWIAKALMGLRLIIEQQCTPVANFVAIDELMVALNSGYKNRRD